MFLHARGLCAELILFSTIVAGCDSGPNPEQAPPVQHFIKAQEALANGDKAGAMELFTKSIEAKPNAWAYLERAKLYLEQDNAEAAIADCEAGLKVDPEHADLKWLLAEAKKPKDQRFKGRFANPPSAGK